VTTNTAGDFGPVTENMLRLMDPSASDAYGVVRSVQCWNGKRTEFLIEHSHLGGRFCLRERWSLPIQCHEWNAFRLFETLEEAQGIAEELDREPMGVEVTHRAANLSECRFDVWLNSSYGNTTRFLIENASLGEALPLGLAALGICAMNTHYMTAGFYLHGEHTQSSRLGRAA
jgi:hypothetical protein